MIYNFSFQNDGFHKFPNNKREANWEIISGLGDY